VIYVLFIQHKILYLKILFGTNAHLITWNGVGKFKTWLIYKKEFVTPTPHSSYSPLERSDAKRNLHQKNTIGAKKFV
jgi:hypothetical protein